MTMSPLDHACSSLQNFPGIVVGTNLPPIARAAIKAFLEASAVNGDIEPEEALELINSLE